MKKILIFGGSGFVGSNLVNNKLFKNFILIYPTRKEVDLMKKKTVKGYIKKIKPDLIINLAGFVGGILKNKNNQLKSLTINSQINLNLLSSAYENKIYNLINFSSSCTYPINEKTPYKEKSMFKGEFEKTNEGYAFSKNLATKYCQIINENHDFKYITIVPCNIYGPYDDFNLETAHLIPSIINKVFQAKKNNKNVINIWGSGRPKREFMYVEDLIRFTFFSIKNFHNMPNLINVGYGKDFSVKYFYSEVSKIIGWKGKFAYDYSKPDGIMKKNVDISLMKKMGFSVKTDLNRGLKKTIKFYKSIL